MLKYVLKRIAMVIPVMIGVSIIVFALMRVFSPDPAPVVLGQHATQEQMDKWREGNGLNEPVVKQYLTYVGDALQGDLGTSYYTNTPVSEEIGARFPATIELALAAITFASIVGVTLGVIAAVKKNSIFDAGGTVIALIGVSIPIFWLGIMFIMVFSGYLHWLPSGGRINVMLEPVEVTGFYMIDALLEGNTAAFQDAAIHLVLPALALGMYSMAIITRMTRSSMLETLGQDYVRTARAKGLTEQQGHRQARTAQLAHPRDHRHRPAVRRVARRRAADRERLLVAGHRQVHGRLHHEVGLPGRAGHRAARGGRVRHREPHGRPHLRVPRPAHQVLVEHGRIAA